MPGIATILFGLSVSITPANQTSPEKLPSFETLARQSQTEVIWSMEVGRLTGGECHAIFTTLIVEDSTPEHRRLRGVRLDLSQPGWKSSVYIDEGLLQSLKENFDGLAMFLARRSDLIERGELSSDTRVGVCSRNDPGRYPLTAGYTFQGPDLPVLIVNEVWFPGVMPTQVSDVLGEAIDELKAR
jgi:hypothetical protein